MGTLILAVTSLLLYSVGTALQALIFRGKLAHNRRLNGAIGLLASIAHALFAGQTIQSEGGYDFGLFQSLIIVSLIIVILSLALNLKRPLQSLFLTVYPIAGLTIILLLIAHTPTKTVSDYSYGMLSHIALSITAYSLFSLAAIQAVLLYLQNQQLKHHQSTVLIRNLPPLQTMESILFEMVWAGVVLLTLAIVTGALFVQDLFAQHLAHKTFFSLVSLAVFIGLLAGRYFRGWRGLTASRWTIAGCLLLMLAFFGSKFVLELVFQRAT